MTTKLTTLALALCISAGSFAQMNVPTSPSSQSITTPKQGMKTPNVQGQTPEMPKAPKAPTTPAAPTAKKGIGSLISQLTSNLSPSTFTDVFAKKEGSFVKKADSTKTVKGASSLLQGLYAGIKPGSLKPGSPATKPDFLSTIKSAVTVKQLASVVSSLEASINPSKFKGTWATLRPLWQAGLQKLAN